MTCFWGLLIPDFRGEHFRKNRFGGLRWTRGAGLGIRLRAVLVIVLTVVGWRSGVNGWVSWGLILQNDPVVLALGWVGQR